MKILFIIFISIILLLNCESSTNRKIKLASLSSNKTSSTLSSSSVIRILPHEQSSIAITNFQNDTGDPALQWLERGLSDMFVTELSQSPYINIINMKNLSELAEQSDMTEKDLFKPAVALEMARKAKSDLLLSGKFYQINDSMYIEVELKDTHSQKFIRREVVHGLGMEQLFAMVDNLSDKVRSNIRGDLEEVHSDPINLVEMTTSVEAFRCYSSALENNEKFFFTESEECIEKAVALDTNFAAGYLFLADIKFRLNKRDEARSALEQANKRIEKLSLADKYNLDLLELRFDYDRKKHIAKLQEAIQQFPTHIDFHIDLGRIYREQRDYESAIEHFEIVKELRPNKKTIYNELGYVHGLRQDYKTALENIGIYKKMAADEPNPFDSAGEILMWAGELEEAIIQLETALSIDPTFYHSSEKLGRIYTELGDYKKALKYFDLAEKHADIEKVTQGVNWNRTLTYWKAGQVEEAIQTLNNIESSVQKKSNLPSFDVAHMKTFIYRSIGETERANQIYENCFKFYENNIDSLKSYHRIDRLVGVILLSEINPQKAISFMDKVQSITDSKDSRALLSLMSGIMALRAQDSEMAQKYFNKDGETQVKLLTHDPNEKWSNVWKYVFDAVMNRSYPIEADEFGEELFKIAKENDRDDLLLIGKIISGLHYQKKNDKNKAEQVFLELGIPWEDNWQVSGPYQNKNTFSYNYTFVPEVSNVDKPTWKFFHDGINDGYIDFSQGLGKSDWATAYAVTYIYSPEEQPVEIRIGSDESFKLWLNNNLTFSRYLQSDSPFDHDKVKVVLHSGYNKVMIKVVNRVHEWGFMCRITDENGKGIEGIKFYHPQEIDRNYATK